MVSDRQHATDALAAIVNVGGTGKGLGDGSRR